MNLNKIPRTPIPQFPYYKPNLNRKLCGRLNYEQKQILYYKDPNLHLKLCDNIQRHVDPKLRTLKHIPYES